MRQSGSRVRLINEYTGPYMALRGTTIHRRSHSERNFPAPPPPPLSSPSHPWQLATAPPGGQQKSAYLRAINAIPFKSGMFYITPPKRSETKGEHSAAVLYANNPRNNSERSKHCNVCTSASSACILRNGCRFMGETTQITFSFLLLLLCRRSSCRPCV